jgi:RNA polymerase-binding transcription factor DksA
MQPPVSLTAEQLKEMLVTMAQEIRKPAELTPKQLAEEAQAKADRESTAKLQLIKLENQINLQHACTHRRKDRTTSCVYEYMGAYLICQQCQAIIHHGARPAGDLGKETSNHIFDTRMFNEHFQETQAGATTF